MKIEEAVKRIEQMGEYERFIDEPISKVSVLNTIRQINQPKTVVPKFVADGYEEIKDNFYLNLHYLAWELIENLNEDDFVPEKALDSDFKRWYHKTETAIQTLNNMHQFGYTVQKEKLYTVEIPNPHEKQLSYVLMRRPNGNVIINVVHSSNLDLLKTDNDLQLTEKEIKKDFEWAWRQGFAKEVTE
ncbi:DUF1642 domain-containing protein [Streptococcus uberis]|uniref:DUF1642 domain-containing protein n=1 Tax=Streptococcus uberis TaxID=1349 RepID=UPI001939C805|nr:DUF1642 domain-containing protein [Streptococcus uberis]